MSAITTEQVRELYAHYAAGESLSGVASRCGYTREGVRRAFQREGLPLRTRGESKNLPPSGRQVRMQLTMG